MQPARAIRIAPKHPIVRVAVLLALGLVVWLPAWGWTAASPKMPSLPSDAQLEAAGARIGRIEIENLQIFDLSDPAENNKIFRLADRLHTPTKPAAIRAMLLFKSGDRYSRQLLDESARNIRLLAVFLREPVIRPIRYHDGLVDIEVITHDVWTLQPGIGYGRSGGANSFGVLFADSNLLGTGKDLGFGHTVNVDRSSNFIRWTDPNVGYSHWADSAFYANNSDGTDFRVAAAYPFYSLETPADLGMDVGDIHRVVHRYSLGEEYDAYDNNWRTGDLYYGRALSVTDAWTDRLLIGWREDRSQFYEAPDYTLLAPLPADRYLSYPFVRLQWIENNFETMRNLQLIERTEDFNFGLQAGVGLGWATPEFGSDRHALLIDTGVSDAFHFGPSQQLFLSSHASSRVEQDSLQDALATASGSYFLATTDLSRLLVSLSGDVGHHLDGDHYFELGGDTGLRGYPLRYQNGNELALFTVEERVYTHWFPLQLFYVGGAAFFDMGRTWGTTLIPTPQLGLLKDAGIGLRLGDARSSLGNIIHVDLAAPLERQPGISRVQFLVTTEQSY